MKKMIWEKYLQICEGVSILIDIPLFMITVMKKIATPNRKMGKRHDLGNKGKNTYRQTFLHV